ncbi:hypothetical protein Q8A67_025817 [Cirrhinus molitorella]|uniref:Uncharacterized protein n=1 Tax=Cirrhinus molitorella TaxID=172907 RepID=A0AA88NYC3_9TELE|nr:hypothetical protein Q8A67_025817 [Cirrhinus molitorella]
MSESNSPSSDNPNDAQRPSASANAAQPNSCQVSEIEPAAAPRGRRPSRAASHTPRRQGSPAPPPSRRPPPSPASSYASVLRSVPAIQKWTVASLRQALSNADVYYSRRMTKTELYNIFCSIQSTPPPKAAGNQATPRGTPYARPEQTSSPTRKGLRSSSRHSRPSASLGRAPDTAAVSPSLPALPAQLQPAAPAQLQPAAPLCAAPAAVSAHSQLLSYPHLFPEAWPVAPPPNSSVRLPPLAAQAHTWSTLPAPPPLSSTSAPGPGPDVCVRLPPQPAPAATVPSLPSLPLARSPFSLASAVPMPIPPNAPALEPPPVASNIRTQILAEIQAAGARCGPTPYPSTSIFRADLPLMLQHYSVSLEHNPALAGTRADLLSVLVWMSVDSPAMAPGQEHEDTLCF